MLAWIKGLFTRLDRGDKAADRIAVALEDMANDIEVARDALRHRLGIAEEQRPALEAAEEKPEKKNGRRRVAV